MMSDNQFIEDLQQRLSELHSLSTRPNSIIGYARPSFTEARAMTPPAKESAVLFPLFKRNEQWHTLFMKRPGGQGVHSDQLSFPGGKLEPFESHVQAALREAEEEVGIVKDQWQIIGELSTLYIPPSHFVVQPFIAFTSHELQFAANPDEVVELIEYPIELLMQPDIVRRKHIFVQKYNREFESGYFDINGHTLWGATAIMVQEFRSLFGFHN
jgi:8-oxo-dGTP pyrophosphatase MutT (NUDIX family)